MSVWYECWLASSNWEIRNKIVEKSFRDSERCSRSRPNYSSSREWCRRPQKRDPAEISVHPYSYSFLSHDPASPGACRSSCSLSRQRSRIISMNESERRKSVPLDTTVKWVHKGRLLKESSRNELGVLSSAQRILRLKSKSCVTRRHDYLRDYLRESPLRLANRHLQIHS